MERPETHFFFSQMTADDVVARTRLMARRFYKTFPDRALGLMATLALPAYCKAVEGGQEPTGLVFASVIPECFRETIHLVKEHVMSLRVSSHFSGGSIIEATCGDCGITQLGQYVDLTPIGDRTVDESAVHIAPITFGLMLQMLEQTVITSFVPSIRNHDYTGSEYAKLMVWTKSISAETRCGIGEMLCAPLFF